MERKFKDFMKNRGVEDKQDIQSIDPKYATIFNIRLSDTGLYFNLKFDDGYYKKELNNLFIPERFYNRVNTLEKNSSNITVNKNNLIAYFLIYPGAILSLGIIFAALFKYLPALEKFLNFTM